MRIFLPDLGKAVASVVCCQWSVAHLAQLLDGYARGCLRVSEIGIFKNYTYTSELNRRAVRDTVNFLYSITTRTVL